MKTPNIDRTSKATLVTGIAFAIVLLLTTATAQPFNHPGILHTQADFDRMTQMVNSGQQPYLDGWNELVNNPYSDAGWNPRPLETVVRGGSGDNVAQLYIDVHRAYQNALRWRISGDTAHGDTARDILNAWSSTLHTVTGNADRYLAAGLFGYQLANVAEMMRDYPGFDVAGMQDMLYDVFYKPLNERFLVGNEYGASHNDACISNYWANWDLCNMAAVVAIGIFLDDRDIYDQGIEYFKNGLGNGSIYNAVPFLHGDLAQWQEAGRAAHYSILGVGLMAAVCEMAWNQGDDLYGWADNRFMKAAEYVARYNNGDEVPFSTYEWGSGTNCTLQTHTVISNAGRDDSRPVWEMIYNHYANRKGLSVPNVAARAASHRPEGGAYPGGHATVHDQVGFGTLTYTRPPGGGNDAVLPDGNIPDGTYRLLARHSDKALDAAGSANGSNVRQWADNDGAAQEWNVTHLGGGEYRITSVSSGHNLDVAGLSHDNGANLQIWPETNGSNQRFAFLPAGDGYYRIVAAHSGKALDVDNASGADGANVQQWRFVSGGNQEWRLAGGDAIAGENRTIASRESGRVLDAYGNSNGSNVIIYSDYGTPNQRWHIDDLGGGEYSIRSAQNGNLSLDVWNWGTGNGTNIALYEYWGGDTQRFLIESVDGGYYRITPVISTGQSLDAAGTENEANVQTWSYWGGDNQQWSIE